MLSASEILQGCSSCDPRHPQTINCVAHLLSDLQSIKVEWLLDKIIPDPAWDVVQFSDAGNLVAMPARMFNLQTQLFLMRLAGATGGLHFDNPHTGSRTPTVDLPLDMELIEQYFYTSHPDVLFVLHRPGNMYDLFFAMSRAAEEPDPKVRSIRINHLRHLAIEKYGEPDVTQLLQVPQLSSTGILEMESVH